MSTSGRPLAGQMARSDEDPQQAVARARADVLGGRGPAAPAAETDRHKRERPTLGPLPAPLERELVHLQTEAIRDREHGGEVDVADLDDQRRRVRQVWAGDGPYYTASVSGPAAPDDGDGARQPETPRGPRLLWLLVAAVLGVRRRRHRTSTP